MQSIIKILGQPKSVYRDKRLYYDGFNVLIGEGKFYVEKLSPPKADEWYDNVFAFTDPAKVLEFVKSSDDKYLIVAKACFEKQVLSGELWKTK
jgi:hypothetical protein